MFCSKCGKEIAEGARFCSGCGAPMGGETQPSAQPQDAADSRKQADPSGNKSIRIAIAVLLGVLVLAGIVAAVWYFAVSRGRDSEETVAGQTEAQAGQEIPTADEEGKAEKVTSDTNEVVCNRILDDIPKSVAAYDFDEETAGVQAVTRSDVEQMPEAADVAIQHVEGIDGEALYLDGTYGLRLEGVGRVGESYTVAFWIRVDELRDWSPFIHIGYNLLDQNRECRLWIGQKTDGASVAPILSSSQAEKGIGFEVRPDWMAETMQPGVWYYIVFTVDGTKTGSHPDSVCGTLYVSGVEVGEGNVAKGMMNADELDINLGINCWDELFPAAYDDVRIWDQALDENQVAELYDAYYRTDETDEEGTAPEMTWKDAYLEYLREIHATEYAEEGGGYQLVNVDRDAVPELYIESGQMAYGAMLCTYANGQVQAEYLSSLGFSYIEGENLFRDWMGHMGAYHDIVYSIVHGKFEVQGHGEYGDEDDGGEDSRGVQFDAGGEPIHEYYYWNDVPVTREEYERQLAEVYDEARAVRPYVNLCSYQDIVEKIENY